MYDRIGECSEAAAVRLEGYSAREGRAHGSLDVIVYACPEHQGEARTEWLSGLTPYATTGRDAQCGDRFTFGSTAAGNTVQAADVHQAEDDVDDQDDVRVIAEEAVRELMAADDPLAAAHEFVRVFEGEIAGGEGR